MHHAVDPMLSEDSLHGEPRHRVRAFGIPDFVKDVVGVGKGIVEGAVDTVTGVADAVTNPVETAKGIGQLFTNPGEAFPAMWDAIKRPIEEDWKQGNPGEAIGRGLFGVAEVIFGAKGLTKLGKVTKGGDAVPDAPRPDVRPKPDGADATAPDAPAPRATVPTNPALVDVPRSYRQKELNHAAKHADDFGVEMRTDPKLVSESNPSGIVTPNNAERAAFQQALDAHVSSPGTIAIEGSYRRNPVSYFVDPETRKVAFFSPDGTFKGGWQLNEAQLRSLLDEGFVQ